MRLVLAASTDSFVAPPEQFILYTATGNFNIASYLAGGYNKVDAYVVGGGGGGGGGAYGINDPATGKYYGGGGGGGGGGGALNAKTGIALSSLPASTLVVVGTGGPGRDISAYNYGDSGGMSIFNSGQPSAVRAGGGGGGGAGRTGDASLGAGGGGAGGCGGDYNTGSTGAFGGYASAPSGAGSSMSYGGGSGGSGGSPSAATIGGTGGNGASSGTYPDIFGGGGGGGGGRGTGLSGTSASAVIPLLNPGKGGAGKLSTGGQYWYNATDYNSAGTQYYGGGGAGCGGGGVNLQALLGYAGLTGQGGYLIKDTYYWFWQNVQATKPGAGGAGGAGGTENTPGLFLGGTAGSNGADGCVLLRVYYA